MAERDAIIEEARERYEYARDQWSEIYKRVKEDLQFSDPTDPQQWPDAVKRERQNAEGGPRPCLVFDQIGQYVRQVINQARRNKPALKFLPVDDSSDPKMAEVLQGLARQTEYQSRADVAYITALDHATRGGLGMFRLITEPVEGGFDGQVCAKILRVVDPTTALPDPDFIEPDGSDQQWCFVEEIIPKKRFEKRWPKARIVDWDDAGWFGKDHVRICDYYRIVGDEGAKRVEWHKITGEEILDSTVFPGSHVPLFPVLGNESWHDGKRQLGGCVRTARDSQITYNFERNAAFEAVAVGPKAPWTAPVEAIEGHEDKWAQANRGNLAYLPWNSINEDGTPIPAPQRVSPAGIAAGWVQLAENSRRDIQSAMGFYDASVGSNPNSQSGRAVLALQEKADVGSFNYIDNLALSISHLGRVLTELWPVIYDAEQVVRIIGEDEEPDFVRVDPTMPRSYAEMPLPDGTQQVVINPGVGKYDVRCVVGPAFATRATEAAAEIGEMVNGNPQMMALLGDVWVKMRNYPESEKIAKRLQAMLPPQVRAAEGEGQAQIPPEVQQVLQQAQAEIQQLQQALKDAESGMEKAKLDAQVKLAIEASRRESAEELARIAADSKQDVAELNGLVQMLLQRMQPPAPLAGAVAEDMREDAAPEMPT